MSIELTDREIDKIVEQCHDPDAGWTRGEPGRDIATAATRKALWWVMLEGAEVATHFTGPFQAGIETLLEELEARAKADGIELVPLGEAPDAE
jgi:hypothetical protein